MELMRVLDNIEKFLRKKRLNFFPSKHVYLRYFIEVQEAFLH